MCHSDFLGHVAVYDDQLWRMHWAHTHTHHHYHHLHNQDHRNVQSGTRVGLQRWNTASDSRQACKTVCTIVEIVTGYSYLPLMRLISVVKRSLFYSRRGLMWWLKDQRGV